MSPVGDKKKSFVRRRFTRRNGINETSLSLKFFFQFLHCSTHSSQFRQQAIEANKQTSKQKLPTMNGSVRLVCFAAVVALLGSQTIPKYDLKELIQLELVPTVEDDDAVAAAELRAEGLEVNVNSKLKEGKKDLKDNQKQSKRSQEDRQMNQAQTESESKIEMPPPPQPLPEKLVLLRVPKASSSSTSAFLRQQLGCITEEFPAGDCTRQNSKICPQIKGCTNHNNRLAYL